MSSKLSVAQAALKNKEREIDELRSDLEAYKQIYELAMKNNDDLNKRMHHLVNVLFEHGIYPSPPIFESEADEE